MTGKEALIKIGNLIKSAFAEEEAPAAVKLSDGTEVQSTLEPGTPIMLVDAEGVAAPAAVGEYELEDARIVVVAEEGIVSEVREAAPAEEPAAEPAEMTAVKTELATAQAALSKITSEFSSHKTASAKFQSDTGELMRQMYALLEILAKEESGNPADEPKQTAFAAKRKEKEEAREKMLNGFKKFAERIKK